MTEEVVVRNLFVRLDNIECKAFVMDKMENRKMNPMLVFLGQVGITFFSTILATIVFPKSFYLWQRPFMPMLFEFRQLANPEWIILVIGTIVPVAVVNTAIWAWCPRFRVFWAVVPFMVALVGVKFLYDSGFKFFLDFSVFRRSLFVEPFVCYSVSFAVVNAGFWFLVGKNGEKHGK